MAGAAATAVQTAPGVSPSYSPYDPGPFYSLSVYECENQPALVRGLIGAHEEIAYLLLLWGGAVAVWLARGEFEPAARLWSLLLVVQSLPYMAALALSLINALPAPRLPQKIGEAVATAAAIDAKPAE